MTMLSKIRRLTRPAKKFWHFMAGLVVYYRRYGGWQFLLKSAQRLLGTKDTSILRRALQAAAYQNWIRNNEPSKTQLEQQRKQPPPRKPLISIVVPCYQTPLARLQELIDSVQSQTYSHWQLCLVLPRPITGEIEDYLTLTSQTDSRIKLIFLDSNLGIAGNTNKAIENAGGEFIAFLDHDDTLAPFALYEVAQAVNQSPKVELIYSDEDKLSDNGRSRHSPHFKPNWSPDLLRSYNYITHLLVVKRSLLETIGPLQSKYDGCQDYDLTLRASEKAQEIVHIPKILYHWRQHEHSTSVNPSAKPEVASLVVKVVQDHIERIGRQGTVQEGPFYGAVKVQYELLASPLISIIIPNHDHPEDLGRCLSSILDKSTYRNYEIIVMENHSQRPETFELYSEYKKRGIKVVPWEKPFNYSEVNNDAAAKAKGEILLFLNNDIEVISPDWLEQMLMHLQYPEVGVVGAKLHYNDGSIQHAGVILGIGGIAGHSHKHFPQNDPGYYGRLQVVQNLSAATGACLMTKRTAFEGVRGFDTELPIAFNDIDFCLKIRQRGYLIVWTPEARLYHHESKTRGYEDTFEKQKRFLAEIEHFNKKWSDTIRNGDPYYSPNLTLSSEDFSINVLA